jgi:hypothetical protein
MIVVADTGPVNYLVLIQEADLLSRFCGQVILPPAVWEELNDPKYASARARLAGASSILASRSASSVCP